MKVRDMSLGTVTSWTYMTYIRHMYAHWKNKTATGPTLWLVWSLFVQTRHAHIHKFIIIQCGNSFLLSRQETREEFSYIVSGFCSCMSNCEARLV